jgi:hypothetical protein
MATARSSAHLDRCGKPQWLGRLRSSCNQCGACSELPLAKEFRMAQPTAFSSRPRYARHAAAGGVGAVHPPIMQFLSANRG